MKAVILAGGLGTRISEETHLKPKPMIEIGGKPILWHIMKIYSAHGINEFIICLGYKGYIIKEFFANYFLHMSDVTFNMSTNQMEIHQQKAEPWKVTLIDTGENTLTGGRLKRIGHFLNQNETFCFTYGDGLSDINISNVIDHHINSNKLATVTIVQPPGRFGSVDLDGNIIKGFIEKPKGDGGWINGGFFVLNERVINYIAGDETSWENRPLEQLAFDGELNAFKHTGFWRPMDTLRDKNELEELWSSNRAPWKKW
jgi:glucose-1-phosphate cytidylyltransferase